MKIVDGQRRAISAVFPGFSESRSGSWTPKEFGVRRPVATKSLFSSGFTPLSRCSRQWSPDPAGLPDRLVSRAHRKPRLQRFSCLLTLLQTKETYRSSIWAGSGDHCGEDLRQVQHPGKTAFSAELSRFFMACPGKCLPKELILQPSEFEKSLVFKRDFDFLKIFTAVVS